MKPVIVTTSWDDGHKLDVKLAALLRRYDIKATFYISPEDHEFPATELLAAEEIRTLAEDFEIGAHTLTHPHLNRLDAIAARREIIGSKERLELITGKPLHSFCYPYGDYSEETKRLVLEAGFSSARTIERFTTHSVDPLATGTSVDTYDHRRDGMTSVLRLCGRRPWQVPQMRRWDNLGKVMFAQARERGEVFHLWGHSHELEAHNDWQRLAAFLAWLKGQENVIFACNADVPPGKPRLLVTAPYFKPRSGGLEEYAYQIAKGLRSTNGWQVTVVASSDKDDAGMDNYDGIRTYHLARQFTLSNTPCGLGWRRELKRIIATEQPDIIVAHAPVPGMLETTASQAKNIPLVVTYHTGSMLKGRRAPDMLIRRYESLVLPRILRKASMIICVADFVQRSAFIRPYSYKSVVITPGVDARLFEPRQAPTAGGHRLMHVGGLRAGEQHKALDTSLRVVAALKPRYPDVQLAIVGDGDQQHHYEALAEALGIAGSVEFCGRLQGQELVRAYQYADILIVPSRKDVRPLVVVEAMACGVPIVASTAEGIPDLVNDGEFGFLVEPDDISGFAAKVSELFNDDALAKRFSERGRRIASADENSWPRQIALTARLLEAIIRELSPAHGAIPPRASRIQVSIGPELISDRAVTRYERAEVVHVAPYYAATPSWFRSERVFIGPLPRLRGTVRRRCPPVGARPRLRRAGNRRRTARQDRNLAPRRAR